MQTNNEFRERQPIEVKNLSHVTVSSVRKTRQIYVVISRFQMIWL